MNRIYWLGLPLVFWFLLWLVGTALNSGKKKPGIYENAGYRDTANLFIRHGWLQYSSKDKKITKGFADDTPMARFYNKSYLSRDVAAFNFGRHDLFNIENGVLLSVNPYAHNMVLPFLDLPGWRGNLTYRPLTGTRATLLGKNLVIELEKPRQSLKDNPDMFRKVELRDVSDAYPLQDISGPAFILLGDPGIVFGKAYMINNSVVFNNQDGGGVADISVSGEKVEKGNWYKLDTGDLLKLSWDHLGKDYYTMLYSTVTEGAPPIAPYRSVNGKWSHTRVSDNMPFFDDLIRALNAAYRGEQHARFSTIHSDLALTLDEALHTKIQHKLEKKCAKLRRSGNLLLPPFRAAVTVMDAKTGELLALASYPGVEDLGELGDTGTRNRMLRNHNLSRLTIGSVAKVLWAAAILESHPSLASLKIPGYNQDSDHVLGIDLGKPLDDHPVPGGDGWVDFGEFIEQSSNRYAAVFLTMALAMDGNRLKAAYHDPELQDKLPEGDVFFLNGRLHSERPPMRWDLISRSGTNLVRPDVTTTLATEDHAEALFHLFDVRYTQKTGGTEDRRHDLLDTRIWEPMLIHLYGSNVPREHPFYGVSPERENLAYNFINNYRGQYLSLILGGGSSTWTNIKLTEAFSRLMTGRRVKASIISRIKNGQRDPEPSMNVAIGALPMDPTNRRILLDAMSRVTGERGTAKLLRTDLEEMNYQLLKKGKVLGMFSKTGSPTNERRPPHQTQPAMNALIRAGALRLQGGHIHYRNKGKISRETENQGGEPKFVRLMRNHNEDNNLLQSYNISALTVINFCHEFNSQRDPHNSPFKVKNQKLISFSKTNLEKSIGAVFTFALGIYDRQAARDRLQVNNQTRRAPLPKIRVNQQPEHALAVSIVIETKGNSVEKAVPFAKEIIKPILFRELVRRLDQAGGLP